MLGYSQGFCKVRAWREANHYLEGGQPVAHRVWFCPVTERVQEVVQHRSSSTSSVARSISPRVYESLAIRVLSVGVTFAPRLFDRVGGISTSDAEDKFVTSREKKKISVRSSVVLEHL
jgi:hypothetical protein